MRSNSRPQLGYEPVGRSAACVGPHLVPHSAFFIVFHLLKAFFTHILQRHRIAHLIRRHGHQNRAPHGHRERTAAVEFDEITPTFRHEIKRRLVLSFIFPHHSPFKRHRLQIAPFLAFGGAYQARRFAFFELYDHVLDVFRTAVFTRAFLRFTANLVSAGFFKDGFPAFTRLLCFHRSRVPFVLTLFRPFGFRHFFCATGVAELPGIRRADLFRFFTAAVFGRRRQRTRHDARAYREHRHETKSYNSHPYHLKVPSSLPHIMLDVSRSLLSSVTSQSHTTAIDNAGSVAVPCGKKDPAPTSEGGIPI
jgi:hypothetical protein